MTALPTEELPAALKNSATIKGAYSKILIFEQAAFTHPDRQRLIYARILGYLLLKPPSDQARTAVALEIASCENENALAENGKMYYNHCLRAFKRTKGRTPVPSQHVSRPSFETRKTMMMGMLVEAPQTHTEAKWNGLIRDEFCCPVTGFYEYSCVEANAELGNFVDTEGKTVGVTSCAHIFAESKNINISGSNDGGNKHHYAASVWAIMLRFGYTKIPAELSGANIHNLKNVITMEVSVHCLFDQLLLYFEATDQPNTYEVRTTLPRYMAPHYRTTVTFTTPDLENLPLPSPDYLAIHAACCQVAHLSGAAENINKILRDLEETKVLSKDGTSAEILEHALLALNHEMRIF